MPTIVVGGSGRKVGKTSLICGLIAALPECRWTAVKITSHDHGKSESIWEETQAGQGTDTARYLSAGARRALLVTVSDGVIPTAELQAAVAPGRWLIFESNQMLSPAKPDVLLGVIGPEETASKPSFAAIRERADAFVCTSLPSPRPTLQDDSCPVFVLPDLLHISSDLIGWMRARLGLSPRALRAATCPWEKARS